MQAMVLSLVGFCAAFLVTGIPYWQIPYSKASLPSSLYGLQLSVVFIVPLMVRLASETALWRAMLAGGLALPAMVLARVMVETMADPTSHNLWPFEIVIATAVGLMVAFPGAFLGGLLARLLRRR